MDTDAHIKSSVEGLTKSRQRLNDIYRDEFLADLTRQATNVPDRYTPRKHDLLEVNDLVLIKDPLTKSVNFPMGRVLKVVQNSLGEVTEALIRKANGEKVRRHVNSLVLLLKVPQTVDDQRTSNTSEQNRGGTPGAGRNKSTRKATVRSKNQTSALAESGSI